MKVVLCSVLSIVAVFVVPAKAQSCESDANRPYDYCAPGCPPDWQSESSGCGIFNSDLCCMAPADYTTARPPSTVSLPPSTCGRSKYGCDAGAPDTGISRANFAEGRIVGGTITFENEFPWQASLKYLGSHSCGGSIVNKNWIMTAAHCVQGGMSTTGRWTVSLGNHHLSSSDAAQQDFEVVEIRSHESYNSRTNDYDVAVMKLSEEITFNNDIAPVCLAASDAGDFNEQLSHITGWGTTRSSGSISEELRKVAVPVITNTMCEDWYNNRYTITDRMICAGTEAGGIDSCQGDSGGPMSVKRGDESEGCQFVQVGVVSWGVGCAGARQPGVYTRVSAVRDWIDNNTPMDM